MVSARSAPGATTDRNFQGCVPIHTATKSSDRYPEVYTNIVKKSIGSRRFGPPEYHGTSSAPCQPSLRARMGLVFGEAKQTASKRKCERG
jgi:hypothetical protein